MITFSAGEVFLLERLTDSDYPRPASCQRTDCSEKPCFKLVRDGIARSWLCREHGREYIRGHEVAYLEPLERRRS